MARKGVSRVYGAAVGGASNAKWFGDGSDGDLVVASGETLQYDVSEDGYVVKQYKSGTIGANAVVTTANRCNGLVLCFTGDVDISGHVNMDGKAPLLNSGEDIAMTVVQIAKCAEHGMTGGNGGNGGSSSTAGGTGGEGYPLGGGWPGGGGARHPGTGYWSDGTKYTSTSGSGGSGTPRPPIGTAMPYPGTTGAGSFGAGAGAVLAQYSSNYSYRGGNGPGGSGASVSKSAGGSIGTHGIAGSAYPGGFIAIFAKGNITLNGTGVISSDGGNGANAAVHNNGYSGGGGGAGAGVVAIVYGGTLVNSGSIRANGGAAGTSGPGGNPGQAGTASVPYIGNIKDFVG